MADRRLLSIRRRVGTADRARYDDVWAELRHAAVDAGAKAWRFRSEEDDRLHIEFLEYAVDSDPRDHRAVVTALDALALIAPGTVDEWSSAG